MLYLASVKIDKEWRYCIVRAVDSEYAQEYIKRAFDLSVDTDEQIRMVPLPYDGAHGKIWELRYKEHESPRRR